MYKELKIRLMNSLKAELDYVAQHESDNPTKFDKLLQIKNMMLIIEQYEEIEPTLAKTINNIAEKKKWEERWKKL